MENRKIENQFREDEIALIKHWDKQRQEWINNVYPKIGGRLRLAHDDNEALSIETDIIKYDENIAVVSAISTTAKGSFKGIGMASVERDERIAPAILELAETRAIARSLRFAGYGVEYCSAEEVSHLENGYRDKSSNDGQRPHQDEYSAAAGNGNNATNSRNGNNGGATPNGNRNGNGNGRLSAKQYKYMVRLNDEMGRNKADLDRHCVELFGTVAQHLSKADASALIESLLAQQ